MPAYLYVGGLWYIFLWNKWKKLSSVLVYNVHKCSYIVNRTIIKRTIFYRTFSNTHKTPNGYSILNLSKNCILERFCKILFYCTYFPRSILELRKYKNGLVSVKHMFILILPPFFPHLHGKGKRAAISKQTCV